MAAPHHLRAGGPQLTRNLIGRRNDLPRQALKYYRFLARTVSIPASGKRERLEVAHEAGGRLRVTRTKIKQDGTTGRVLYQCTFDPAVTRELRLYAQGGAAGFAVTGTTPSPIRVRLVGGAGNDTFAVDEGLHQRGKLLVYDRSDEPSTLPAAGRARINTSADTAVNRFEPVGFQYDFLQPLFLAGYSKNYGVQLVGNFIYQKQGFRRAPYASRQRLLANYGFGNSSLLLSYAGEFKRAVGRHDLLVNVVSKGPNYTSNFFGIGNETTFVNEGNQRIRYYRSVYNLVTADVRLSQAYGRWQVSGACSASIIRATARKTTTGF